MFKKGPGKPGSKLRIRDMMQAFLKPGEIISPQLMGKAPGTGVPQGAPTSPLLSLLVLKDTVNLACEMTKMYADDGLWATDNNSWLPPPPTRWKDLTGVEIHPEKSGWVKRNGEWLKPLKFLGLTYDGKTDVLRASTRKGATIEVPDFVRAYMVAKDHPLLPRLLSQSNKKRIGSKDPEFFFEGLNELFGRVAGVVNWEMMAHNTAMGFVMSRLYQGSFDLDAIKQNFELTMTPKS